MSTEHDEHGPTDDPRWLDEPGSVDTIVRALIGVSVASVAADLFYHKHGHWSWQEWIGFDAVSRFAPIGGQGGA